MCYMRASESVAWLGGASPAHLRLGIARQLVPKEVEGAALHPAHTLRPLLR
jgi:hypothetical protein